MKIFIVGSTGRVGKSLLKSLSTTDHQIYAGARKVEQVPQYNNVKAVHFDLDWTPEEMAKQLHGMDVIINVSGSGGKSLLKVDLYGAVKLMQAAEKAEVKRFILLSTIFALQPEKWVGPGFDSLKDYYIAKYFADLYLTKETRLAYTILQPGTLTEEKGTGLIAINDNQSGKNTIEDVAQTLKALIYTDQAIGKVITMHNGSLPITQALEEL
ncbi:SDR family oxidoreductase [Lactococcus taiwanensis]|uniref:SDR family oxidoreductase n=1 Tax=Lactococcus taiwanensis TaxID=1151742 RepID=UPI001963F207|nr:SDR family oxidoreductase [Lactococcus taiwanensis]QRZ11675.1 SDR family oxidoreductase [Lactococcus taiwanensis]